MILTFAVWIFALYVWGIVGYIAACLWLGWLWRRKHLNGAWPYSPSLFYAEALFLGCVWPYAAPRLALRYWRNRNWSPPPMRTQREWLELQEQQGPNGEEP